MNNIIQFNFQEKEVRIITDEKGEPWWVAKDVCDVLGYSNPSKTIADHLDDDERSNEMLDRGGSILLINESGLYSLILKSNKPEAKPFRKWVTSEILPTIRKTGSYQVQETQKPVTLVPAIKELHAAIRIAKIFGLNKNQALISANRAVRNITGTDCMAVMQITHLISEDQEQHFTPSDIGKMFNGVSGQKANQLLHDLGFQEQSRDHKNRIKWMVTEKGKPFAILKDTGKRNGDGTPVVQTFWKESILTVLKEAVAR